MSLIKGSNFISVVSGIGGNWDIQRSAEAGQRKRKDTLQGEFLSFMSKDLSKCFSNEHEKCMNYL